MIDREHVQLRLTVDLAILTVRDNRLQVLVVERGNEPYRGWDALPGGFLRAGEDLGEAAVRELAEETNLNGSALHLEQLATYGAPDRDPRGRVVSVAYLAIAPDLPTPAAGSDARRAGWAPVDLVRGTLAFDHGQILAEAVERARSHLEFTTLAAAFCGQEFTIGDLRNVYEVVWNTPLDPRNFARKVAHTEGFVEPTGGKRVPETGRPATLYRRGPAQALNPPLMRNADASLAAPDSTLASHAWAPRAASVVVMPRCHARWPARMVRESGWIPRRGISVTREEVRAGGVVRSRAAVASGALHRRRGARRRRDEGGDRDRATGRAPAGWPASRRRLRRPGRGDGGGVRGGGCRWRADRRLAAGARSRRRQSPPVRRAADRAG